MLGNSARTQVNAQNRYQNFYSDEANLYYGELRVSRPSDKKYNDASDATRDLNYRKGSNGYQTILHELCHNLGLKHTDASPLFPDVNPEKSESDPGRYGLNNVVATVMSYRDYDVWNQRTGSSNPKLTPSTRIILDANNKQISDTGNLGFARTPMALDVAVLQKMFGKNNSHNSGNNTYILPFKSDADFGWECLWDSNGIDTMATPNTEQSVQIDLRNANLLDNSTAAAGFYSYILNGAQGGFTIAHDWDGQTFGNDEEGINIGQCVIENAKGGKGADTINGNQYNNIIRGYERDDKINGLGGNDTIYGDGGIDTILSGLGNDVIHGGIGSDVLNGEEGDDELYGAGVNHAFGNGETGANQAQSNSDGFGDIDQLTGGLGRDRFHLIGNGRAAYNDRNRNSTGRNDYAAIQDFTVGQDKIVLIGTANDYLLTTWGANTDLFLRAAGAGGSNEMIAFIKGVPGLNLNDNTCFEFVPGSPGAV